MDLLLQQGIRPVHVRLINVPCVTKSTKGTRRPKAHIKVMHEKTEEHKCVTCNNVFSSQSNMKANNSAIHLEIRKFNSDNCMTKCTRQKGLNNHVRQHHSLEKKSCTKCGKAFGYKPSMERHVKSCRSSAKHACPSCDKVFTATRGPFRPPPHLRSLLESV